MIRKNLILMLFIGNNIKKKDKDNDGNEHIAQADILE